jgi:hypothetical protein
VSVEEGLMGLGWAVEDEMGVEMGVEVEAGVEKK